MVGVMNKRCEHPGCPKGPSFNYPGETSGRYCSKHKEDGMVDVVNKRCEHPGCPKGPSFNYPGETSRRYCSKHKEDGMVNVSTKNCLRNHVHVLRSI